MMTGHVLSEQYKGLTFEKEYCGSSENVINNVLLNKADAGVTLNSELDKESPDVLDQIRRILETQEIPSHPLAAHPRVPSSVRAAVKKAVLTLSATPADVELLRNVWLALPVATSYEKDFRALEVIDVKELSDWGK
jgi:phosphonate transport system substrate-binding protein